MFRFFLLSLLASQPLLAQDVAPFVEQVGDESPISSGDVLSEQSPTQQMPISEAPSASPPVDPSKLAEEARKKKEALQKKMAGAYKPLFFDNDFSYLNDPAYEDSHWGEELKQLEIGDCWTLDIGGQYRARYHGERNMRGLGLTGRDDDFLLHRTRLFANAKFGDTIRLYGEFLDAESNYENYAPRAIEVNRADMLNIFADLLLHDFDAGSLTARVGRQELLYGNQRLISPLDWANTRRAFEGAKLMWAGEDWNADFFYTRPVLVQPHRFDSPDYNQEFMGAYATRKSDPNSVVDLYAMQYNNSSQGQAFRYTITGARWLKKEGDWTFETEGAFQYGTTTQQTGHSAGFAMAGLGYTWTDAPWTPTLTGYYDWASGGNLRGGRRGFDHAFPLAHKYLGFMDLFGRSNINTPNALLTLKPTPKSQLLLWYYYFFLDNLNDTPYNVNMTPFQPAIAPQSRDLGHEVDVIFTYNLSDREEIILGYSHFFSGQYYNALPFSGDADFFYTQYLINF
jgi:Alginate export